VPAADVRLNPSCLYHQHRICRTRTDRYCSSIGPMTANKNTELKPKSSDIYLTFETFFYNIDGILEA
jgi:hypothetical protein